MKSCPPVSVLVVEDSAVVRSRIRSMLSELKQVGDVSEARSAQEALRVFDATRPQVVILDIRLAGGSSGLDVLRHIKEQPQPCTAIMLTNLAEDEVQHACMELGADHFFNKANEFERAVEVIARSPVALAQASA